MRVLITGGTGYLGAAVARATAASGHTPVVFARRATASAAPGTRVNGDVRDPEAVRAAAEGCDAICHVAALVSMWRPRRQDFDDVNVGGLDNVLDAARVNGISRVVYTSSFLALPPAGRQSPLIANDYQRTKALAHRRALEGIERGAPLVILYPGVVYGPGSFSEGNLVGRLLVDHVRGRLAGIVGADRVWSFAYVDDVAAGHVAALERGSIGGRYGLGGENAKQIRPFTYLQEMTGRRLPRRVPYAAAVALGAFEEARARLTGASPLLTRRTARIFRYDWPVDSTRAIEELGYQITPLETGLARTIAELPGP